MGLSFPNPQRYQEAFVRGMQEYAKVLEELRSLAKAYTVTGYPFQAPSGTVFQVSGAGEEGWHVYILEQNGHLTSPVWWHEGQKLDFLAHHKTLIELYADKVNGHFKV